PCRPRPARGANRTAPAAAAAAAAMTPPGPSVALSSWITATHAADAPARSAAYILPVPRGKRVSARQTHTPLQTNGTVLRRRIAASAEIAAADGSVENGRRIWITKQTASVTANSSADSAR